MEWSEKLQQAFFTLLRAGLWHVNQDDWSCFPLSEGEWKSIWKQATRQSVRGLVFDGLCLLPEHLMPGIQLVVVWTAEVERIEQRNRQMNKVLLELVRSLTEIEKAPLVLKGQGVAQLYEQPLLRECGDIDLYFDDVQSEVILLDWIRSKGVSIHTEPDGTHAYQWKGMDVEHHRRIFDLYAGGIQPYLDRQLQKYGSTCMPLLGDEQSKIRVLSPVLNLLLLNTHLLKHLMGHGIGLRQFCDLARAYHVWKNAYDGEGLKECYRRCGLLRWSRLLHMMLVEHLGLPMAELPYKDTLHSSDYLLKRVMEEGNFGKDASTRGDATQPVWQRKCHTGFAFLGNLRFSLTYAPRESLGLVRSLIIGNINS